MSRLSTGGAFGARHIGGRVFPARSSVSRREHAHGNLQCSFCGKGQRDVRKLIAGPTVYICDECIRLCNDIIADEVERQDARPPVSLPTPSEIKALPRRLRHRSGRARRRSSRSRSTTTTSASTPASRFAPRAAGTAAPRGAPRRSSSRSRTSSSSARPARGRRCSPSRSRASSTSRSPSPTRRRSPRPATSGEDVENIIQNLLHNADYDVEKASRGIVYIDEIDKVARKGDSPSPTRDVGGEGVQQALLKIVEGTRANVTPRGGKKYNQQEYIQVDTSNVLFVCGGAFCGLEQVIRRRVGVKGLGFGANIERKEEGTLGEIAGAGGARGPDPVRDDPGVRGAHADCGDALRSRPRATSSRSSRSRRTRS